VNAASSCYIQAVRTRVFAMPLRGSLKLDAATEVRLRRLAEARRRPADLLMREAIEQYVEREEGRAKFHEDGLAAACHGGRGRCMARTARSRRGCGTALAAQLGCGAHHLDPTGIADLARLHAFLAPKNRAAASRAIRTIRQGVKALATHPDMGRPAEGMAPHFREWFIPFGSSGYLALYRHEGELVAILAVRHGKEAGY
jgi:plasmid stabilization system protein ParE/predicted transcriptional regulator